MLETAPQEAAARLAHGTAARRSGCRRRPASGLRFAERARCVLPAVCCGRSRIRPSCLWIRGAESVLDGPPVVAVVGSRNATPGGLADCADSGSRSCRCGPGGGQWPRPRDRRRRSSRGPRARGDDGRGARHAASTSCILASTALARRVAERARCCRSIRRGRGRIPSTFRCGTASSAACRGRSSSSKPRRRAGRSSPRERPRAGAGRAGGARAVWFPVAIGAAMPS